MSYPNYYLVKKPFDYELVIFVGLGVTVLAILAWFYWGSYVYRLSDERIANRLMSKYKKEVSEDQSLLASNGVLNANGTASAVMTISNKGIGMTNVSQEVFTLPVKETCSPLDKTCVSL